MRTLTTYLSLVKFSHTIFALPFAIVGFLMGCVEQSTVPLRVFPLIILCMVFARSAAMAFNRYLDRDIDALNPRTRVREIPSGQISPTNALLFVIASSVAFVATTWFINPLCFQLSFVALAVVLGYSYTKRFTPLCHLVLGAGLALAPIGAYLAVTAQWHVLPILLSVVVFTWVSGFDIIYALQDYEFDRSQGLYSIPAALGKPAALGVARLLHTLSASLLMYFYIQWVSWHGTQFGLLLLIGTVVFIGLLVYQHFLVKADDLRRVDMAFFTTNGIASLLYGVSFVLDYFIQF